jgi:hypothetical protein
LIQIVKERFGQRFRLTKAANSTLTLCSVKLLFEVFNRFKTRLSNLEKPSLSGPVEANSYASTLYKKTP